MLRRLLILVTVVALLPLLMSFRLQPASAGREALLYDIRGAFVAASDDIPAVLVTETDRLVNDAIISTMRDRLLPRAILTVRIERMTTTPLLVGTKQQVTVSVEAIAVGTGEAIAEGQFTVSVFSLRPGPVNLPLAARITDRLAVEFRLAGDRRSTLTTALFSGR